MRKNNTIYLESIMLEALKLDQLSMSDKFMMMEELWTNMSQNLSDNSFSPKWHLDELEKREDRVLSGEANFSNLVDVKKRLRKKYDEHHRS